MPLFLSRHADEHEQRVSRPLLNAGILIIPTILIGIAMTLLLGTPVKIVADLKALLTDTSAPRPDPVQPATKIQSTADAQDLPPTSTGAPTHDELPATFDSADQKQPEISETPTGALLQQFQTWAARQDAQAQVEPVPPVEDARAPVLQDAPAPVLQDAPATVRPVQRHRRIRPAQNARAEMRPLRNPEARARRERNGRVEVRPARDVRAQDQPVQNAASPSFLPSFGSRQ